MDLDEIAWCEHRPHGIPVAAVGTDEGGEGDDPGLGEEFGDGTDPPDVLLAILGRKTEPEAAREGIAMPVPEQCRGGIEAEANIVAIEHEAADAAGVEPVIDEIGQRALARSGEAGEPEDAALVPGGLLPIDTADSMGVPTDVDDFG